MQIEDTSIVRGIPRLQGILFFFYSNHNPIVLVILTIGFVLF